MFKSLTTPSFAVTSSRANPLTSSVKVTVTTVPDAPTLVGLREVVYTFGGVLSTFTEVLSVTAVIPNPALPALSS